MFSDNLFDFNTDVFLTKLLLVSDKAEYVRGFSNEILASALVSLVNFRYVSNEENQSYERIDEAINLVENEMKARINDYIREEEREVKENVMFALKHLNPQEYIILPFSEDEPFVLESEITDVNHEYDGIVICKYGAIIVECEKYCTNKDVFLQSKKGQKEGMIGNDITQLDFKIRLLKEIFRVNEIDIPVFGIIYINNNSASSLIPENTKYPVVATLDILLDSIEGIKTDNEFEFEEMEKWLDVIEKSQKVAFKEGE